MRTRDSDREKAVKGMLEQWGIVKRIEIKQQGLGPKKPGYVLMMTPSKGGNLQHDQGMEDFKSIMITLKSLNYLHYQTASKIYQDELEPKQIARELGTTERTINRRLKRAIHYIDINWNTSQYLNEDEKPLQMCL